MDVNSPLYPNLTIDYCSLQKNCVPLPNISHRTSILAPTLICCRLEIYFCQPFNLAFAVISEAVDYTFIAKSWCYNTKMAYPRPRYDEVFRQHIGNHTVLQSTAATVQQTGAGADTARRARKMMKLTGQVKPMLELRGRPLKVTPGIEDPIREYVAGCTQPYTLEEIQVMLLDEHDIAVDISTISRHLKTMNLTFKKGERVHPDRDEPVRLGYMTRIMSMYRANQLVFVDESASNKRGLDRRWGWSPRGVPYRMSRTFPRELNLTNV